MGVGVLAVLWSLASFFAYLIWYRFLHDTVLDSKHLAVKALIVVALGVFISLVIMSVFFALVQHTLEVTYEYPLGLVYLFY